MSEKDKKPITPCLSVAWRDGITDKGEPVKEIRISHDPEVCPGAKAQASHSGPANVATDDYRDGWDRIFGGKVERGQA